MYMNLTDLKSFLYDPQWFRLAEPRHQSDLGRTRNREPGHAHSLDRRHGNNVVSDWIRGATEDEYSLSYLARRYLGVNYPNRSVELFNEKEYPRILCYEILAEDAYLIWELASVLLDQMDADQRWLYFYGELKIALILNEMSLYGIPC